MTQVWNLASKIHLAILLIINLNLFSLSLLFFINFNFHYNRTPFSSDIIDTFFNDFHPSPEFHTSRLSAPFPSPHSRYYHPMMLHRPDWNCPVRHECYTWRFSNTPYSQYPLSYRRRDRCIDPPPPPQVQPAINICENSFDNGFVRLVERCDRHFPRKVENISIDSRDVDVVNDDTFSKIASSSTAVILGNVSTFDNN